MTNQQTDFLLIAKGEKRIFRSGCLRGHLALFLIRLRRIPLPLRRGRGEGMGSPENEHLVTTIV